jgi:negative regulator of replication initiation
MIEDSCLSLISIGTSYTDILRRLLQIQGVLAPVAVVIDAHALMIVSISFVFVLAVFTLSV